MRYKLLGRSGLRVSELCLGTMTFGDDWGWGATKSQSKEIFDAFIEAGGNYIDTANNYTKGQREIAGEFIASDRDPLWSHEIHQSERHETLTSVATIARICSVPLKEVCNA